MLYVFLLLYIYHNVLVNKAYHQNRSILTILAFTAILFGNSEI